MPTVCLIPGDGIGQEVVPAAARVLAAAAPDLAFVSADAGWECFRRCGTALPEATVQAVALADATLFGATQSPSGPVAGYTSPILALRRQFDLYANLRPCTSLVPGTRPIDLLIVRENTEGLYSGRERRKGDVAIAERVITRSASTRIARLAFEKVRLRAASRAEARSQLATDDQAQPIVPVPRRPVVTMVHKANVLKVSDGLFREACLAVATYYPDVEVREMLVDAAAMWLARDPGRFDVIVTTNLFGDILSDLAAGLVGGLGIAPSANLGVGRVAVFEPVHGSAPDIAGQGVANPIGAILSGAMLLEHLGRAGAAERVQRAVESSIAAGALPPDLGGPLSTDQMTGAILGNL
jgi:homoisocitrate dehydrogenase